MQRFEHQMQQPVEVVRIIRRSTQGVTNPFLCEGADGTRYWAKGNNAGKRALCCEWLAGCLAQKIGLPLPSFAVLRVPKEILDNCMGQSFAELGSGLVFGSCHIDGAQEIGFEDAMTVMRKQPELADQTLVFDWWIRNEDRTLGEKGGNPNILIRVNDRQMHIIDHNIAFDRKWDEGRFFAGHVFSSRRNTLVPNWLLAFRDTLRQGYTEIEDIWAEMPDDWKYHDSELTLPVDISIEEVRGILDRVETEWDGVWK